MAKGLLGCSEPFPVPWHLEGAWGKLLHPMTPEQLGTSRNGGKLSQEKGLVLRAEH